MRYFLIACFLLLVHYTNAQEKKKVEVFEQPEKAKPFHPNDKICFDYKVMFKGSFSGREATGCFFINTEIGAVLGFGFDIAGKSGCNYDFNNSNFNASLQTLNGNLYLYHNSKEKIPGKSGDGLLKHYVRTSNTEPGSTERILTGKKFFYKDEFREFSGGEYKGRKYITDDGFVVYILVDGNFPETFESFQFLGAYGIGFLETSKGTFLILGYDANGKSQSETVSFQKVAGSECFYAPQFKKEEITKIITHIGENETESTEIEKKISKAKKLTETGKNPCAALKLKFHEEEKRQNDLQKEQFEYLKNKKVNHQKKQDMQSAYGKYDPFSTFKTHRMEAQYKFCDLLENIIKERYKKDSEKAKAIEKKNCLEGKIIELEKLEAKWEAAKNNYRNNNTGLQQEQRRIMMETVEVMKKYKCG